MSYLESKEVSVQNLSKYGRQIDVSFQCEKIY